MPLTKDESSDATVISATPNSRLTEDNRLGLLDSLTEAAHGAVDHAAVELLRSVEEVHKERGADRATVVNRFPRVSRQKTCKTHGQSELKRMPSRAWIIANSRVMASTAPLDAVYAS